MHGPDLALRERRSRAKHGRLLYLPEGMPFRLAQLHKKRLPPFAPKILKGLVATEVPLTHKDIQKKYKDRFQNGRNHSYKRMVLDEAFADYTPTRSRSTCGLCPPATQGRHNANSHLDADSDAWIWLASASRCMETMCIQLHLASRCMAAHGICI